MSENLPIRRRANLLSAAHILGSTPASDYADLYLPGGSTNYPIWQSWLDVGCAVRFDSIAIAAAFNAYLPAPSSELNNAGTCVDDASIGTIVWVTPTNAQGEVLGTSSVANVSDTSRYSHYLKATNFGFAIPSTATIVGIKVSIRKDQQPTGNTYVSDNSIKIVKGGTISGTNKADTVTPWPDVSAPEWVDHGGPTDLWGLSWTYSDINASNFGVAVSAQRTATPTGTTSAKVAAFRITVYYSEDLTTKLQIRCGGYGWEDIPGSNKTVSITGTSQEYTIVIYKEAGDFTYKDLPAELRLLATSLVAVKILVYTLQNSAIITGKSIDGNLTEYIYDASKYLLGARHLAGESSETAVIQIDNPRYEPIFMSYFDPGLVGRIDTLEVNYNIISSINSGTQSTVLYFQIRPKGGTIWRDLGSFGQTLNTTPTAQGNVNKYIKPYEFYNLITNPGLETGTYSYWAAANDAVIDATTKHRGGYSSKLIASGSSVNGAGHGWVEVDTDKIYTCSFWLNITAYTAGNHKCVIQFWDSTRTIITTTTVTTRTATTGGWVKDTFTVGPTNSGADVTYAANTKYIIIFELWDSTPTGTSYTDDYCIIEWANLLKNGGLETGDFTYWAGQNDAVIDATTKHSGSYGAKLVASGSLVNGAGTPAMYPDLNRVYECSLWLNITAYTAGTHEILVQFWDLDSTFISETVIATRTATTGGWVKETFTVGPEGSGADVNYVDNTYSVLFYERWNNTPTGISYTDDYEAFRLDVSLVTNGGFETGDGTGWISSNVVTEDKHNGSYSTKLVAAGSTVYGAESSQSMPLDANYTYLFKCWLKIPSYTAGTHYIYMECYDINDGLLSTITIRQDAGTVSSWTEITAIIGPDGAGADFVFPDYTAGVRVGHYWSGTPTGTAFIDDISLQLRESTLEFKAPFEYRAVFSAVGTGKTFTFTTNDTHNFCRAIGKVD